MHLEDTSQGFPKINVIFKNICSLKPEEFSSCNWRHRHDIRWKFFYSVLFYSFYLGKAKLCSMVAMPIPGTTQIIGSIEAGMWGIILTGLLHKSSVGRRTVNWWTPNNSLSDKAPSTVPRAPRCMYGRNEHRVICTIFCASNGEAKDTVWESGKLSGNK